ncbi:MAG TPA: C10 family peptidase [Bacteroidales bacterium]|nr:C10 family peptidase [Bacteroidales bacterium]
MKKIILLLVLFLGGISFSALAKIVEIRDAKLAGKNFYYEQINRQNSVPYSSLAIVEEFVVSSANVPDYYVFNFRDKGFIIVSAEDAAHPVLGYSFDNSYSPDNLPENFIGWMDHYKQEIDYIRSNNLPSSPENQGEWAHLLTANSNDLSPMRGTTDVAPLLTCDFDQTFPYNELCPADPASPGGYEGHVPVGCVATAMAQIMYYWRYPHQGSGYHCISPTPPEYGPQCADFANTIYDWDGINDQPGKECLPVATVSYQAGVAVDMDYSPEGSGANMQKVPNALMTYFRYASGVSFNIKDNYSSSTWSGMLRTDLDAGQPLEYSGYPVTGAGHAWVCDGYQGTDYFHFNFGWSGSANGYYYLDNINPSGYDFSNDQVAILHIKPDPANYPTYCSGQTNESTYDFGSFEDGSGPIQDYQNNSNCSWLIAPDDSVHTVTLSFSRFNTDAADVVTVYDGDNTSAPVLGTFSGSGTPSAVTSTGAKMLVTFTSNGSTTAPGFLANYSTNLYNFCMASSTLTDPTGDLSDGSGRLMYRNGSSCRWYIKPTNAATVTLNFNSFDTEQDNDKVNVMDLGSGTQLGLFSGNSIPPSVTANSGMMLVIWSSNKSIRGNGWDASYTITVGTDDQKSFNDLTVYPNPVNDLLTIRFTMADLQNVKIEMLSLNGGTLYQEQVSNVKGNFEKSLDLSSWTKGIYLLRLTSDKGIVTRKIVVE